MVRRLKVNKRWVERRLDRFRTKYVPVSAINLQGKWLAEAGFESGGYVTVQVLDGRLVIENCPGSEKAA